MENVYAKSSTDTLFLFRKGVETYNYSNRTLGSINYIDVTNPLKILVGHPDMATISVLDNTLRETSRIYLPDAGLLQDSTVFCLADDNQIWVYDDNNIRLVKVGEESNIIEIAPPFFEDLGFVPQVNYMVQYENTLILNAPERGLLLFDQFGKFNKLVPIKNVKHLQLAGEHILFGLDGGIHSYYTRFFNRNMLFENLPAHNGFQLTQDHLYILTPSGIMRRDN